MLEFEDGCQCLLVFLLAPVDTLLNIAIDTKIIYSSFKQEENLSTYVVIIRLWDINE